MLRKKSDRFAFVDEQGKYFANLAKAAAPITEYSAATARHFRLQALKQLFRRPALRATA
jgi:hypothetical protein